MLLMVSTGLFHSALLLVPQTRASATQFNMTVILANSTTSLHWSPTCSTGNLSCALVEPPPGWISLALQDCQGKTQISQDLLWLVFTVTVMDALLLQCYLSVFQLDEDLYGKAGQHDAAPVCPDQRDTMVLRGRVVAVECGVAELELELDNNDFALPLPPGCSTSCRAQSTFFR